jgi:ankyrin repeat protein
MFEAAGAGHVEAMEWLSEQGADINARNLWGNTPVFYATVEAMKWLKKQGADINARNNRGETPLFHASGDGHVEAMKWLKEQGADINAENNKGYTPMFAAAHWNQFEAMKWLKEQGVDINASDSNGCTLLHKAVSRGRIGTITSLHILGADMNRAEMNCTGQTPLEMARAISNSDIVLWMECLATENEEDIDPRKFAEFKNAEARREFVRRVGIERLVQALGAETLDHHDDYELLLVDLGGETGKVPFLKMLNPSVGVWHLEAVPKDIDTVKAALAWRNQSDFAPEQLT